MEDATPILENPDRDQRLVHAVCRGHSTVPSVAVKTLVVISLKKPYVPPPSKCPLPYKYRRHFWHLFSFHLSEIKEGKKQEICLCGLVTVISPRAHIYSLFPPKYASQIVLLNIGTGFLKITLKIKYRNQTPKCSHKKYNWTGFM